MDAERLRRLNELFEAAIAAADEERAALLARAGAEDAALRDELVALLDEHADSAGLLGDHCGESDVLRTEVDDGSAWTDLVGGGEALPERVGRYRILGLIGRGGMGMVLKGRDDDIGRDVAIKVLLDGDSRPRVKARFTEEGQIGGQLQHPAIVPVYELGLVAGERPYLAMKFVEGETLAALLARRTGEPLHRQHFLGIFEQVCHGVAYAHARGVIHRDLKPANLMVGAFGEVQVMDWGLAKVVGRRGATGGSGATEDEAAAGIHTVRSGVPATASLQGSVLGTPSYMAPEQARGEVDDLDPRADVFALGAILCEILTGAPPYCGGATQEIIERARAADLDDAVAGLRECRADDEVVSLAIQCLVADRTARPADAGAVAGRIRGYLESLEERARTAALQATESRVRAEGERRARRLTLALGVLVMAAVLVASAVWVNVRTERQTRLATLEQRLGRALVVADQLRREAEERGLREFSKWQAALTATRGARELVSEEIGAELRGEVERLVEVVEPRYRLADLVRRLDRVRSGAEFQRQADFAFRQADGYREALESFLGDGFLERPVTDNVRAVVASGGADEIAVGLDLWARAVQQTEGLQSARFHGLVELAQNVDDDAWRNRLRSAVRTANRPQLEELAASAELAAQSAHTLYLLAFYLFRFDPENDRFLDVYRRAQVIHPTDFWINFDLGQLTSGAEAVRYATAAVVARPDNPHAIGCLAVALAQDDQVEEAERQMQRAQALVGEDEEILYCLSLVRSAAGDVAGACAAQLRRVALREAAGTVIPEDYARLALLRTLTGDLEAARQEFEKTLARDARERRFRLGRASRATVLNNYGSLLMRVGEPGEAVGRFRESTRLVPSALGLKNLGWALQELGDFPAALLAFDGALELDPQLVVARHHRAEIFLALRRFDSAASEHGRAIALAPELPFPYVNLLPILESPVPLADATTFGLLTTLDDVVHGSRRRHPLAPVLYIAAWGRSPDPLHASRVLRVARARVEASRRRDPRDLGSLARVLVLRERLPEAIVALEEAVILPGAPPPLAAALEDLRQRVHPDLVSYASIDAAVSRMESGADDGSALLDAFTAVAGGADAGSRRAYLEARLLMREARLEPARARILEVLEVDRTRTEPFLALWECLNGIDASGAGARFQELLAAGPLPERPLPVASEAPIPANDGETLDGETAHSLRTGPFRHLDPRVEHRATHWQLRRVDGDYERDPVLDLWSREALVERPIPAALLLPGDYRWRARHLDSGGRVSGFGAEGSLRVVTDQLEAIPVDLTDHFELDVVADPGDDEEDSFDLAGHQLVVDGPTVRGLPVDRWMGPHRLGRYDRPNSVVVSSERTTALRIALPEGRYLAVRFLVASTEGDSSLPITLEDAAGNAFPAMLRAPDWFTDPSPAEPDPGWSPVWNGMDRARAGRITDRDDPALFEIVVPLEDRLELTALVLRRGEADYASAGSRFHLMAVTAVCRADR